MDAMKMTAQPQKKFTADEGLFWSMVSDNRDVMRVLQTLNEFNLPNAYVGAGCLVQTVWNRLSGFPLDRGIKDIDIVYFNPADLSKETEVAIEDAVTRRFSDIPLEFDVKNQARVHLWYEQRFGVAIEPYKSTESSIDTWPATASAVGVRLEGGQPVIYSSFGLGDLLNMIARPNKRLVTQDVYEKKVARWKAIWPRLEVVAWEQEPACS